MIVEVRGRDACEAVEHTEDSTARDQREQEEDGRDNECSNDRELVWGITPSLN